MTENEAEFKEEPRKEYQPPYQAQPYAGQYPYYPYKKLYRSTTNKWVAGVCGGLAEYFNKDPVLIRLLWVVFTIFSIGVGVIAYVLFWIFVKKYPSYYILPAPHPPSDRYGAVHYHYYYKKPREERR